MSSAMALQISSDPVFIIGGSEKHEKLINHLIQIMLGPRIHLGCEVGAQ